MRGKRVIAAAVLGGLLAIGGCAKGPDDGAIVTSIKAQMFSDAELKTASLEVTSNKGVVTLNGSVPDVAARLDAYKIASGTAGVTKVIDQMTVQEAQATPQPEAKPAPKPAPEPVKKPVRKKAPPPPPTVAENVEPAPPQPAPPPPAPEPEPQPAPAPPPQPPPPPPPQPKQVEIPAGTTITIRMIDGVDSKVNHAGEIFHASLDAPIVVGDDVIVPRGADVYVRLASANSAGHYTGKSELHMELVKLEFQGRSYPMVSSTYDVSGSSRGSNTAKKVGIGAVAGTVIGALAGGGKGAAIGAAAGAGSGVVWNGVTRGEQVKIPSETKLDFTLDQPTTVTVQPRVSANYGSQN
ncbi:MAG TPA: BON domain-containing protein [Candidatus Micrarchaeaceae archaeon]|nr:BON domain-containing protein [Candidatus Micrarchaeaceae archaeon]